MYTRKCSPVLLRKYYESTPANDFATMKLRHVVSEPLEQREGGEKLIVENILDYCCKILGRAQNQPTNYLQSLEALDATSCKHDIK